MTPAATDGPAYPVEAAAAARSWEELATAARACTACAELVASRTLVVPGTAPAGAQVLLVGEAPGAEEDLAGLPFVGRSGRLLGELLAEAGLSRSRVAVANVLKCRPPRNRAPRRAEVRTCRPWLERQVELADPRVVVTLGASALAWALGPAARIGELHGRAVPYAGRLLVPTYHPSAAIRFGPRGAPLAALREDLATVAAMVAETVRVAVPDAAATRRVGAAMAGLVRAGDLVLLSGQLGAGKTTLAQGIGVGLGVRGPVTSPTFVIARVHPSLAGGPPMVHADAYRLGGWDELEDLDLEATLDEAVTVVEWGEGVAEGLAPERLEVRVERAVGEAGPGGDGRTVHVRGVGRRWAGVDLAAALGVGPTA